MSQLESKHRDKTAVIGVVGLGYVGLPLAVAFAQTGLKVFAFDTQAERVEAVNQGKSYITGTSSQTLSTLVTSNHFGMMINKIKDKKLKFLLKDISESFGIHLPMRSKIIEFLF